MTFFYLVENQNRISNIQQGISNIQQSKYQTLGQTSSFDIPCSLFDIQNNQNQQDQNSTIVTPSPPCSLGG